MRQKTVTMFIEDYYDEKPFEVDERVALVEKYDADCDKSVFSIRRNYTPKYEDSFQGSWNNVYTYFHGYRKVIKAGETHEASVGYGLLQKVTVGKELK